MIDKRDFTEFAEEPGIDDRVSMVEDYCKAERQLTQARETIGAAQHQAEKLQAEMATLRDRLAAGLGLDVPSNKVQAVRGDY